MSKSTHNANFGLVHDAWGRLVLIDAEGQRHVGVTALRIFPTSDADHWISILDAKGRELVLIDDPGRLALPLRELLDEDLARREFMPEILQITYVSSIMEPCEWEVVTDRGPTRFVLKSEDDIRRLGPYSGLVIDSQGVRYLIRDVRTFDMYGKRSIEQYI
ncbi:MAG TPA: DUF1854 domain-containing protein [Pirellulaceae bacterium]|nr:DUF1854 domain-containing protein [Pirellulaceae bacterium]